MIRARKALLSAAPLAIGLALAGCNRHPPQADQALLAQTDQLPPLPASLPLSTAPVSGPIARAPGAAALPPARPIPFGAVSPDEDYAWIDRADMLYDTIGDAPPDYAFDYDGVQPWAWRTAGGYDIYAEPIDGGYRTYYYDPGADEPFLVRDPYYSYGYSDGRLVAVYEQGRLVGRAEAARQAQAASRYWARARALRNAGARPARRPVPAQRWAQQRPYFVQAHEQWTEARQRDPDWQRLRAREARNPARERLLAERQVRAAAAQRFDQWQRQGLRGPAPRLYPAAVAPAQARAETVAAARAQQVRLAQAAQARARQDQARQVQLRAQAQQQMQARVATQQARATQIAQARAQARVQVQAQARAQVQAQAQLQARQRNRAALAARQQNAQAQQARARQQAAAQAQTRQAAVAQARGRQQAAAAQAQARARQQAVAQARQRAAVQARGRQQAAVQAQARQQAAAQARARQQAAAQGRAHQQAAAQAQARARQQAAAVQAQARQQTAAQARVRQQAAAAQAQVRAAQVRAAAPRAVAAHAAAAARAGEPPRRGHGHEQ